VLMLEDKEFLKQELKETERTTVTELQVNESFSISSLIEFEVKMTKCAMDGLWKE
jgi:hypothetical protein